MATLSHTQNALLTEHFRYTPLTLLDDIINVVNELVFRAINAIDEGLANIPPQSLGFRLDPDTTSALTSDEAKHDALAELKENEIGNGIVALESLLNATVDRDFDKFEIYCLRNILAIGHEEEEAEELSRWIRLEHYRGLELDTQDAPRPEDVLLQRRKLNETLKLNAMLKAEEAKNAAILEQLDLLTGKGGTEEAQGRLAFLMNSSQTSKAESVRYAMAQLPALRQLVAQLKESSQKLPNARVARVNEESRQAKRREYLDSQARRAMARRGVEAGSEAAGGSAGRKIGRDEVEGMEAVVQALGSAPQARQRDEDEMEQ